MIPEIHQIPMSVYASIIARAMSAADLPDDDRAKIMAAVTKYSRFSMNNDNCPLVRADMIEHLSTYQIGAFIVEHDDSVRRYFYNKPVQVRYYTEIEIIG